MQAPAGGSGRGDRTPAQWPVDRADAVHERTQAAEPAVRRRRAIASICSKWSTMRCSKPSASTPWSSSSPTAIAGSAVAERKSGPDSQPGRGKGSRPGRHAGRRVRPEASDPARTRSARPDQRRLLQQAGRLAHAVSARGRSRAIAPKRCASWARATPRIWFARRCCCIPPDRLAGAIGARGCRSSRECHADARVSKDLPANARTRGAGRSMPPAPWVRSGSG